MSFSNAVQHKIDTKTKPLGALGELESIARQLCLIQNTLTPQITQPHILVFAGDHGIAAEGVSAYPQEVTWQMVMNFVAGGAAINVFCKQHDLGLKVIDAGVNYEFPKDLPIRNQKIARGTRNFLTQTAMTEAQLDQALSAGAATVMEFAGQGCNLVGFGEMGIANTTSATALISQLTHIRLEEVTGRGTGLNDRQLEHKLAVLKQAFEFHGSEQMTDPSKVLMTFGGFEIAQMVGAMLEAKRRNMVILVDGFIASAAYLVAYRIDGTVAENAIFCHESNERGHQKLLAFLKVKPLLNLNMRLGEGSACALAYPLIVSAVRFLNDMASFEGAGVSDAKEPAV